MKYLEVEGAGRPEAKGRCRQDSGSTSRQGRPSDLRSDVFCRSGARVWGSIWWSPSLIWRSIGSSVLELSMLGLWVRFFSLDFRFGFFLSSAVCWFLNSIYWVLVCLVFFFRIHGFATVICWVCFTLFFFFRLGLLYWLMLGFFFWWACSVIIFFFFQIWVQNLFWGFFFSLIVEQKIFLF